MGITSSRAWILAASLLAVSAVAHGAGLGKLNVISALGEPFNAEIELVAEKKEISSLAARLASQEAFGRAGLGYSSALDNVKIKIEKRADGEPYVHLTTTEPVNEPFLDLLLELSWSSGRISREFTALLDPPSLIADRAAQKASEAEVRASPPKPEPQPEPLAEPAAQAPTADAAAAEAPATEAPAAASEAPAVTEAPPAVEPAPSGPVETIGGQMATYHTEKNVNSTSRGGTATSAAGRESYGPVKRGDTLTKIALATKPADVSLEQMLVLLFRGNPDAFFAKNMNRLKTGKIIKLPTPDQYGSIEQTDARKEVLVQARDWNVYREQLAVAAGEATPTEEPAQQEAAGKITTKVEDQAAVAKQQPKEVLKLSQSEPSATAAAGTPAGDAKTAQGQARVRALEEELVARDKAVKDANERVGKLEKTIKDLQALLEIKNKGMADLQKPAGPPPATATPAQPAPAQPARKPEAKPETPATSPVAPAPPPEAKSAPAQTPPAPDGAPPKTEIAPPPQPAPPPKPAPRPVPPRAPEPSLLDRVMEQPAYLGAAVGVLVLIGALAVRAVKRRRESKSKTEEAGPAPEVGAARYTSQAFNSNDTDLSAANARAASNIAEEVDPVAEAEIFLAYGRDAQAEDLLKEALTAFPTRYEIHVKLLQIYANRKDTKAFEQLARDLQKGTGGSGELWDQAVRLGYQIDPDNPRYAAGRPRGGEVAAITAVAAPGAADNVDFNIGFEDPNATTSTDIDLGDDAAQLEKTQTIAPSAFESQEDTTILRPAAASTVDFSVDLPAAGTAAEETEAPPKQEGNTIDFDFDLNALAAPSASVPAAEEPKPAAGGVDFDTSLESPGEPTTGSGAVQEIDLSGINLDLGTGTSPQVSATGKDDHWYDVQTKFDLAKAYQEMGDKDGAREILKEVLREGDAEQKTAAQTVLANLDS